MVYRHPYQRTFATALDTVNIGHCSGARPNCRAILVRKFGRDRSVLTRLLPLVIAPRD